MKTAWENSKQFVNLPVILTGRNNKKSDTAYVFQKSGFFAEQADTLASKKSKGAKYPPAQGGGIRSVFLYSLFKPI